MIIWFIRDIDLDDISDRSGILSLGTPILQCCYCPNQYLTHILLFCCIFSTWSLCTCMIGFPVRATGSFKKIKHIYKTFNIFIITNSMADYNHIWKLILPTLLQIVVFSSKFSMISEHNCGSISWVKHQILSLSSWIVCGLLLYSYVSCIFNKNNPAKLHSLGGQLT